MSIIIPLHSCAPYFKTLFIALIAKANGNQSLYLNHRYLFPKVPIFFTRFNFKLFRALEYLRFPSRVICLKFLKRFLQSLGPPEGIFVRAERLAVCQGLMEVIVWMREMDR